MTLRRRPAAVSARAPSPFAARWAPGRVRGFTLIELLVVVVIIGILITFAVISIGGRALDDQLDGEAKRLDQLLRLAIEEAELKGVDLGFRFTAERFEFLALANDGKWAPYAENGPFRSRLLEEPFYIDLRVAGRVVPPAVDGEAKDGEKIPPVPQVQLLSSGEVIDPFVLDYRARGHRSYCRIEGDAVGRFTYVCQQDRA